MCCYIALRLLFAKTEWAHLLPPLLAGHVPQTPGHLGSPHLDLLHILLQLGDGQAQQ